MNKRERELSDLCVGHPIEKLEKIADWSFYTVDGDSLDEYWTERDAFEDGVDASGKKSFVAFVGIEQGLAIQSDDESDEEMVLMFVGDSFEEVKKTLQEKLND